MDEHRAQSLASADPRPAETLSLLFSWWYASDTEWVRPIEIQSKQRNRGLVDDQMDYGFNGDCNGAVYRQHSVEGEAGTWRLVSYSNVSDDKGIVKKEVFGRKPTGLLTYTPDGRMMVIGANEVRKPLTFADWFAGPVEERALAFSTFFGYAGRYTVSGNTVTHHIEVALLQSWANTDQVRLVHLQGDRLVLRTTTPFQQDGVEYAYQELVWDRVK